MNVGINSWGEKISQKLFVHIRVHNKVTRVLIVWENMIISVDEDLLFLLFLYSTKKNPSLDAIDFL